MDPNQTLVNGWTKFKRDEKGKVKFRTNDEGEFVLTKQPKNFKGKKNSDLWKRFLIIFRKHKVSFTWIKGHAGHIENEKCDLFKALQFLLALVNSREVFKKFLYELLKEKLVDNLWNFYKEIC